MGFVMRAQLTLHGACTPACKLCMQACRRLDDPPNPPVDNPPDPPVGDPTSSPVGNTVEPPAGDPTDPYTGNPIDSL